MQSFTLPITLAGELADDLIQWFCVDCQAKKEEFEALYCEKCFKAHYPEYE